LQPQDIYKKCMMNAFTYRTGIHTYVRTYYSSFPCAHIHARGEAGRNAWHHRTSTSTSTAAPAPPAGQQHRTGLHRCMRCVRPLLLADVRDVQNVRTAPACFTFTAESEHCSDRHACSCSYLPLTYWLCMARGQ
jgi:hypothetical protein